MDVCVLEKAELKHDSSRRDAITLGQIYLSHWGREATVAVSLFDLESK